MTTTMPTAAVRMIPPHEVARLAAVGQARDFIDVRTPAEYAEVHAAGARLTPLERLDCAAVLAARVAPGEPLYVICRTGGRAMKACQKLRTAGCPDVVCVEGGTTAWESAGLPVVRAQGPGKVMSLERQVRIAAGSLVLTGLALGWWASPWFFVLSGFVGAGLVFAGLTDTCGMGMLLARLPWNQRQSRQNTKK